MHHASSPGLASPPPRVVVMGVSGSGKSTLAAALARATELAYIEGDDFHPPANVAKMAAGVPLADADRAAWLAALAGRLHQARMGGHGVVMSCSALKRSYRDRLREGAPDLFLVFLDGPATLIGARMAMRTDHYMPPTLLASQFAVLEPPQSDERALRLDVAQSVEVLLAQTLNWLSASAGAARQALTPLVEPND